MDRERSRKPLASRPSGAMSSDECTRLGAAQTKGSECTPGSAAPLPAKPLASYRPLRVYKHREGFARFCTSKYDPSPANLGNPFVHLTNVAVQKRGADYNQHHGGKWNLRHCRLHVEATRGRAARQTARQVAARSARAAAAGGLGRERRCAAGASGRAN